MSDVSLLFNIVGKDSTEAATKKAARNLDGVRHAAGLLAEGFAVMEGVEFLKGTVEAAEQAERVNRQTAAAVASTGHAAHVTAGQVEELGFKLGEADGVSHQVVQQSENMLLSFTNIRNGVGKNNDIFNKASATTLDLAAAMNHGAVTQDGVKTASIQLGKALNDPIKGLGSLARVGVSFNAQQKEQIKQMVKAGNVAGAQKLILAELGKEFGGQAAAAADPMTRLSVLFEDIKEKIGMKLLPVVDKLATIIATRVVPAVSRWINDMRPFVDFISAHSTTFLALAAGIGAVATTIAVVTAVQKAWTLATEVFEAVMATNPIYLLALVLIGIGVALVVAYKRSEEFRNIVNAAFHAVSAVVMGVFNWIKGHWPLLLGVLAGPVGLAVALIATHWRAIKAGATAVKDWIVDKFNALVGFVKGLPGRIAGAASGMFDGIKNAFKSAINWIISGWNRLHFTIPSFDTHIPGIGTVGGASFGVPQIPYLAKGGNITRDGLAVVGERGPELVSLNRGAQVTPLTGGHGKGGHVTVTLNVDGVDADLKRLIRKMVRVDGRGDVQVAFGRA